MNLLCTCFDRGPFPKHQQDKLHLLLLRRIGSHQSDSFAGHRSWLNRFVFHRSLCIGLFCCVVPQHSSSSSPPHSTGRLSRQPASQPKQSPDPPRPPTPTPTTRQPNNQPSCVFFIVAGKFDVQTPRPHTLDHHQHRGGGGFQ